MFVAPRIPWLPETFSSYRVFFFSFHFPTSANILDNMVKSNKHNDMRHALEFLIELLDNWPSFWIPLGVNTFAPHYIYNNIIVFYLKRLKVTKKISKWAIPNCKKKNKVLTQNYINLGKWNNVGNLGNWATRIVFLLWVGRVYWKFL